MDELNRGSCRCIADQVSWCSCKYVVCIWFFAFVFIFFQDVNLYGKIGIS